MMMSGNEEHSVGRENPRYGSYSLSLFPRANKYKLEGQEDRPRVVIDHVIEEKKTGPQKEFGHGVSVAMTYSRGSGR